MTATCNEPIISGSVYCQRLLGHKSEHRSTLTKRGNIGPKAPVDPTPAKRKPARKVRVIPQATSKRQVAAPSKTVHTRKFHESGKPSSRFAGVKGPAKRPVLDQPCGVCLAPKGKWALYRVANRQQVCKSCTAKVALFNQPVAA